MTCDVCGIEIPKGQRYQGNKYKSLHFCSENCWKRYCAIKTKPKAVVNFKPEHGSDRRTFTDYIQDWTNDNVNWPFIMKQAKDIQEEYELDWHTMYMVLKYCRVYEGLEWNLEYGLYQFFPKYIKPTEDFRETIRNNRENSADLPPEVTTQVVNRDNTIKRKWHEKCTDDKEEW